MASHSRGNVKPPRYEQYLFPSRSHIKSILTELVHLDGNRVVVRATRHARARVGCAPCTPFVQG